MSVIINKQKIKSIAFDISLLYITLHLIYTISISIYDVFHLKRLKWEDAELVSYGGEDSSPTCDFINEEENIKVSREYNAFYGLLVRLWGMDIEYDKEAYYDIIFYLKEKDYKKIQRGQLNYEDFVLFRENKKYPNNINYQEYIPFFGVRKIEDSSPFILTLFLDIWLDNHDIVTIFAPLLLMGLLIGIIFSGKDKDRENEFDMKEEEKDIGEKNSHRVSILANFYDKFILYGSITSFVACTLDVFIL